LYIDENYRGKDVGTELVRKVEEFARENDCSLVRMNTYSFQARGFYEKLGYSLWGGLDGDKGESYYALVKRLRKLK